MKNFKILASTLLLTFSMSSIGFADGNITVLINSLKLKTDVAPQIVSERTMVPIRAIAENMGATVKWNEEAQLVTINSSKGTMTLTLNSNQAIVNGQKVKLDQPAKAISDRTMVPIRFISENMGARVKWNDKTRTVAIEQSESTNKSPLTRIDLANDIKDMDDFIHYYGEPVMKRTKYDDYFDDSVYYLDYDFGTAEFIPYYEKEGHELCYLVSTKNLVGVPRNIKIGDSVQDVISKFSNDGEYNRYDGYDSEDDFRILYQIDNENLSSMGIISYDTSGQVNTVRYVIDYETGGASNIILNFKDNKVYSIEFFYGYM